ncbi:glutathione S-transferase 1-like [Cydia pomonella]|uniref:glutathione S-transferase 1-like n=1 Tax=Cydia pomonella TaxID=82600 RepID=UPI002ADD4968|nr:glutathione S-transferase 1-like [Cydia pomonella]
MPIDLYYLPYSPPCRPVLVLADALKLKLNLKELNTRAGEHLTPEFKKINPQHCLPTLVDDDLTLWESRAILTYLATKYGDGSLYPADHKLRAAVDQRLYFDMGTLYQRFTDYLYPQLFGNQPADEEKLKKLEEALEFLNIFLEGKPWVAGSTLTVADYSIICTVNSIIALDVDVYKYPNIKEWYERAKSSMPGFNVSEQVIELLKKLFQDFKAKNTSV